MSTRPSFSIPAQSSNTEPPARHVITFRDDALEEGLALLERRTGVASLARATDFAECALDPVQADAAGGSLFPSLGLAVVRLDAEAASGLAAVLGGDSSILAIEPERTFYALGNGDLSINYLRGYRDAVNHLYDAASTIGEAPVSGEAVAYQDDATSTWGLKAVNALNSRFSGRGVRVAVLDTGFDLQHPDFAGRAVTARSFVAGTDAMDRVGHGTHCIGTSCGNKDHNGRRYGVATSALIYSGKVLGDEGSGTTRDILAGMEWAISNRCDVISMSLGNAVATSSPAYEAAGRRALQNGCLIVAAAGNHRNSAPMPPGVVGQPANSPSIIAVGAIDNQLRLAPFSCTSGAAAGANVDVAGPGVAVYSSVPMTKRYDIYSGTSMATPHTAGVAALYAEAFRARGYYLWHLLVSRARRLVIPSQDVGAGLIQAPV